MVDDSPLLEEKEALPLVVEDILQTNVLHHTITYAPSKDLDGSWALTWNLPLPYRSFTEEQRADVLNWCHELLGEPITKKNARKDNTDV